MDNGVPTEIDFVLDLRTSGVTQLLHKKNRSPLPGTREESAPNCSFFVPVPGLGVFDATSTNMMQVNERRNLIAALNGL